MNNRKKLMTSSAIVLMLILLGCSAEESTESEEHPFSGRFNGLRVESSYQPEYSIVDTINSDTPDWVVVYRNTAIIANQTSDTSYTVSTKDGRIIVPYYSVITVNSDGSVEVDQKTKDTFHHFTDDDLDTTIQEVQHEMESPTRQ